MPECLFCTPQEEQVLWQGATCRVILAPEPQYPGFCRVVWQAHVREMSDLPLSARRHFMDTVFNVERALRELMHPDKINLASLGNQVPHLHWHVIPRFADDPHFPGPVWGMPLRGGTQRAVAVNPLRALLAQYCSSP